MQTPVAESPVESPAAAPATPAGSPAPTPPASEQEARDVAEAAREEEWRHHGFVRDLFDAFTGTPKIDRPDRAALEDNPLAVPGFRF